MLKVPEEKRWLCPKRSVRFLERNQSARRETIRVSEKKQLDRQKKSDKGDIRETRVSEMKQHQLLKALHSCAFLLLDIVSQHHLLVADYGWFLYLMAYQPLWVI